MMRKVPEDEGCGLSNGHQYYYPVLSVHGAAIQIDHTLLLFKDELLSLLSGMNESGFREII
jgi:hypothetical protein